MKRCRRYRLWRLRGRINRCGRVLGDETWFCRQVAETNKLELLKWAREEKKCEWDEETINRAASQGNLEMVKYCVANECPIDVEACANAAMAVISRYSNTYAKKRKRLGIRNCLLGG